MKQCSLLFLLMSSFFSSGFIHAQGFIAGTLVKTPQGFCAIETLKNGDSILSADEKHFNVESRVVGTRSKQVHALVRIITNTAIIETTLDHLFYLQVEQRWVPARYLKHRDVLNSSDEGIITVENVEVITKTTDVFCITVDKYHTFFVSDNSVLTHNFPLVVIPLISFEGGKLIIAGASAIFGALGISLFKHAAKKIAREMGANGQGSSNSAQDPEDQDPKNKRDKNRYKEEPVSKERAYEVAEEMGYKETTDRPFGNHHEKVFKNGNTYISYDKYGHRGGVWKVGTRRSGRLYTADLYLKRIIGK